MLKFEDYRLKFEGYKLQIAGCTLHVARSKFHVAGCSLQVAGCMLHVTGYRSFDRMLLTCTACCRYQIVTDHVLTCFITRLV